MEAKVAVVSPDGQLLFVCATSGIGVISKAEQVIPDDGPAFFGEVIIEVLRPFFYRGKAARSQSKLHKVSLCLDSSHVCKEAALLLVLNDLGEEPVIGLAGFLQL